MKDEMKATMLSLHNGPVKVNVILSTADLIAELEKRRPKCSECVRCDDICTTPCLWAYEFKRDNFKSSGKGVK